MILRGIQKFKLIIPDVLRYFRPARIAVNMIYSLREFGGTEWWYYSIK